MALDPKGSERYQCRAGALRLPPERAPRPARGVLSAGRAPPGAVSRPPTPPHPTEAPGATPFRWPLLAFALGAGCGTDPAALERDLARCDRPREWAIEHVWDGDLRAPCGERWLLEHAPDGRDDALSPLRAARVVVRDLLRGAPVPAEASLALRPEGLPRDVWAAHLEALTEVLPEGFGDPWLAARVGLEREDRAAAASLVAWSAWDPDPTRRLEVIARVGELFELDVACVLSRDGDAAGGPRCSHWALADALAGDEGPPGRRERPSDALWRERGPRAAGMAGDWVGAWADWVGGDPARGSIVRPGAEREPAGALWSGGTERANDLLRGELGLAPYPAAPAERVVSGAGGRAASVIPW